MAPNPTHSRSRAAFFYPLVAVASALFLFDISFIMLKVPVEKTMGIVQKVFYFHVPCAYSMYIGATACFVGSVGYLMRGSDFWDAVARAGAELTVVFGGIVLITGSLWAAKAWGVFWTWDPRLTTVALSVLIYVAYLVLRAFSGSGAGEARFAAALGILGAATLPVIKFSVQKWSGQHPQVITGKGGGLHDPNMTIALTVSFIAFTLLVIAFLWVRVELELCRARLTAAEEDAIDLGLDHRMET